ncbi:hypothetical protein HNP46_006366 [Pseudomonas nitritireducens]|uniref:Uncharacterized protein n=1 Tax=Pseudomonas nitroreducens TaxID=46680 RepID=A0A7W7KSC5_PSENT|nr:hypothetical protein [Pseudomonas nitritireducens]MBB4867453.1 hypothetical protein [Pseudomonas nitritireducens]
MNQDNAAANASSLRKLFERTNNWITNTRQKSQSKATSPLKASLRALASIFVGVAIGYGIVWLCVFVLISGITWGAKQQRTLIALDAFQTCETNRAGCISTLQVVAKQGSQIAYAMLRANLIRLETERHKVMYEEQDPRLNDIADFREANLVFLEAAKYLPDYELYTLLRFSTEIWDKTEQERKRKFAEEHSPLLFRTLLLEKTGLNDTEKKTLSDCYVTLSEKYKDKIPGFWDKETWGGCGIQREERDRVEFDFP